MSSTLFLPPGICPVREELYAQCFDELIRQVTINAPERGLLLLRVRDEIRMTITAYQTLYQSSVTFGARKQLQAERGKQELEGQIEELEKSRGTQQKLGGSLCGRAKEGAHYVGEDGGEKGGRYAGEEMRMISDPHSGKIVIELGVWVWGYDRG